MAADTSPPHNGAWTSGSNTPYWELSEGHPLFPALNRDLDVDVVIVGGGIAGLTIAYDLVRSGKLVALVEDGELGSGETGRTSAHLVSALDDRYYHLEELFGKDDVRRIAQSHRQALDD